MLKNSIYLLLIYLLGFLPCLSIAQVDINLFGSSYLIEDHLLEQLIESPTMQRLKKIDQSGPLTYFGLAPTFTRYDHSVGVLALLHKAGASQKEQVAGLLHDASHTAFSHVADHLFYESNAEKSYQDMIHLDFLEKMDVPKFTQAYGISLKDLDPDLSTYKALEQHLPDLCADRIQYIIHTGVVFEKISSTQAQNIMNDLQFKNGDWFFTNQESARTFADLSLNFTKELWGSPWNFVFYELFSDVLYQAIQIGLISFDDIKFGTDLAVLDRLIQTNDIGLKSKLDRLYRFNSDQFKVLPYDDRASLRVKPKFRGVNPYVQQGNTYKRLTELDQSFALSFYQIKKWCEDGYAVKILD
jgi:HD superfamily phosphohydrolase